MRITIAPAAAPWLRFRGWVPPGTDVPALLARIAALCAAGRAPEEAARAAWPTSV